ncbi:hypothetical protein SmJEL517_g04419 [Synchytrium microbalum]|uniref:RRM domain-containing protein n=1 Tax=Synchytrium microbalum TaxID=1806994 RepID=A0A507C2X5_9FUNG|nr:uncharacterized protein SmJEL517_g04419 [Synchytrium microbalum]TPX32434.1 hypothetical protein SmJEL517_g04419 [Synchytrium microbalum]
MPHYPLNTCTLPTSEGSYSIHPYPNPYTIHLLHSFFLTHQPHRYAFVEFEVPRDAEDAMADMQGRRFDGAPLTIQWTKGAPGRSWRLGEDQGPPGRGPPPQGRGRSPSPRRGRSPSPGYRRGPPPPRDDLPPRREFDLPTRRIDDYDRRGSDIGRDVRDIRDLRDDRGAERDDRPPTSNLPSANSDRSWN